MQYFFLGGISISIITSYIFTRAILLGGKRGREGIILGPPIFPSVKTRLLGADHDNAAWAIRICLVCCRKCWTTP